MQDEVTGTDLTNSTLQDDTQSGTDDLLYNLGGTTEESYGEIDNTISPIKNMGRRSGMIREEKFTMAGTILPTQARKKEEASS